ncbi:uncharacterized protein LOC126847003 isoform X2 [Adelges cooleyi]|uniref:uncharacterized protein LOC126847003 isoform X2 n=1 Tax=Adelges cooleyi TaxID=133065 RepID=UPI00217F8B25|nr:uncharacterized protein LOC126847003 isoform X2 [Adelges cooleyi]
MMKIIILFTLFSIINVSYVAGGNSCKSQGTSIKSKNLGRYDKLSDNLNDIPEPPNTEQNYPGESSCSNENQQEKLVEELEELYRVEILQLLNSMPTLDKKDVKFDQNDIKLLTEECKLDKNCLKQKKASVKKYQQKMQAIQCINGLFVLKVLDDLKTMEPVFQHQHYLKSMLSLLSIAKWVAYPWQIEMFTFAEGLAASDADLGLYEEHLKNNEKRIRDNTLAVVCQCVNDKYLLSYRDKTSSSSVTSTMISGLVEGVYSQMQLLYKSDEFRHYGHLELYTARNLMLWHLHTRHDVIFDLAMYDYQLDTSNVERQLMGYVAQYNPQESYHGWILDPIGGNKYNVLISKCIYLRLVYAAWVHLYTYRILLSRSSEVNASLLEVWKTLVDPLKRALRLFRFNGNIYWSALNIMMDDLSNIGIEQLAARERYTRNYFCRAAEELELASASDIDRQLKQLNVSEDHGVTYERIDANSNVLNMYITRIVHALKPIDGRFVRIIVSAEGNETFFKHSKKN